MGQEKTRVEFSNLDRILFPDPGISKRQIIEYYIRIAPWMLQFLENRPLSLQRFPRGIDHSGFFEKSVPPGTPEWVDTFSRFHEKGLDSEYILCNNLDTLLWLSNLAAIEINITLSRVPRPGDPDLAFFDIDPKPPACFQDAIDAALILKEILDGLAIRSYIKTSGKSGLHVVIPLIEGYSFHQVKNFVHGTGLLMEKQSKNISDSRDAGTVFIDYLQNSAWKTMACPYSIRPVKGATVSTPLSWREILEDIKPEDFNVATVISRKGDPWQDIFENRQEIVVK